MQTTGKVHFATSACFLLVTAWIGLIGCSVSLTPDSDNGLPLTASFTLGDIGFFSLSAGTPVSNSARITGLNTPSSMPAVAALRLSASDVVVTPLESGREAPAGQSLVGSFSMTYRIAAGGSNDPCVEGIVVGTITATTDSGNVTLSNPSLSLGTSTISMVISGDFTLCITVEADFDGMIVLDQIAFDFNGGVNTGGEDASDSNDSNDLSDDGESDGGIFDDNGGVPDDVDGATEDDADATEDDDIPDDSSSDAGQEEQDPEPEDEDIGTSLIYTNLTNDMDQDPDSSFDTTNTQPTVSGDGTIVAYLSNTPTSGETDGVENDEVMLMISGAKVQVTETGELTNSSGSPYNITNYGPVISRDGSTLVFGSDGDLLSGGVTGTEQIYRYDVASGSLRQLSLMDTPPTGINADYVGSPRISAEGDVVAWIETDAECPEFACDVEKRFRVTDRDGNALLTVVFDSTFTFSDYTLSGDGTTVALTSSSDPAGQNSGGRNQLFLMSIPGGQITQISQLAATSGEWTPSYNAPGLSDDASLIAVWTNDPAIATSEYSVLAVLDGTGGLITTLAEQSIDFSAGDDDLGRPRFTPGGGYVCFRTAWTFGFEQKNFRATVGSKELVDVGVGNKTHSPTMTDDGSTLIIVGDGYQFNPDQGSSLNPDGNAEIWSVVIAP